MVTPRKQETNKRWKQNNREWVRAYQAEYRGSAPTWPVCPQGLINYARRKFPALENIPTLALTAFYAATKEWEAKQIAKGQPATRWEKTC